MKVAIRPGYPEELLNGTDTVACGEIRYALSLAEALANHDHEVHIFSNRATWGKTEPIPNITFKKLAPSSESYDLFIDGDGFWGLQDNVEWLPNVKLLMRPKFSLEPEGIEPKFPPYIERNNQIVIYPYTHRPLGLETERNPYYKKTYCVPFPYAEKLPETNNWNKSYLTWVVRCDSYQDSDLIKDTINRLEMFARQYNLKLLIIDNIKSVHKKCVKKYAASSTKIIPIRPPIREFRRILQETKILYLLNAYSGMTIEAILHGSNVSSLNNPLHDQKCTDEDDYIHQLLCSKDIYDTVWGNYLKQYESFIQKNAVEHISTIYSSLNGDIL